MIHRIKSVGVSNFRVLADILDFDFDANVVLIYGPNGSGKTCLLSAIEYALTGKVNHLTEYGEDYPRVLTRHGVNEPASVQLTLEIDHRTQKIERTVGTPSGRSPIDSTTLQFFAERCYLSQANLTRLLRIYRGEGKEDSPVVQYAKQLLRLDPLDRLAKGLHVVGHSSRYHKAVPSLRILEQKHDELRQRVSSADEDLKVAEQDHVDANAAFIQAINVFKSTTDKAESIPETATDAIKLLDTELQSKEKYKERLDAALKRLKPLQTKALSLTAAPPKPDISPSRLEDARAAYRTEENRLNAALEIHITKLRALSVEVSSEEGLLPDQRVERLIHAVEARVLPVTRKLSDIRHALERQRSLEEQQNHLKKQLREFDELDSTAETKLRQFSSALAIVLDQLNSNVCPICDRDFSETNGDLVSHVRDKLSRLGEEADTLQLRLQQRASLSETLAKLERELVALKEQLPSNEKEFSEIEKTQQELSSVLGELKALDLEVFYQARHRMSEVEQKVRLSEVGKSKRAGWKTDFIQVQTGLSDIANELDHLPPQEKESLNAAAERLYASVSQKFQQIEAHIDKIKVALEAARQAVGTEREVAKRAIASNEAKTIFNRAEKGLGRVTNIVNIAKEVRRAALKTQEELLHEIFSEQLNMLILDIYTRLIRSEPFTPKLMPPTRTRSGALLASIQAYKNGDKAFEDIGSVLSAGNLNTAALSMFVALHLAERPRVQVLVFDDPIQSMDDVHVAQLAALFRALAYNSDSSRQLILAVHERSLFEYLKTELSPTSVPGRLVTHELVQIGHQVKVQTAAQTWTGDDVAFG